MVKSLPIIQLMVLAVIIPSLLANGHTRIKDLKPKEEDLNKEPELIAAHKLWPMPSTYTVLGGVTLPIIDFCNFQFQFVSGGQIPQVAELTKVYKQLMFPHCSAEEYESSYFSSEDENHSSKVKALQGNHNLLVVTINDTNTVLVSRETDETYVLEVNSLSLALVAQNYVGLVRGLETFSQMITPDGNGNPEILSTPVHIQDTPRFVHRGVSLDTARHFISKQKIFEIMDGMMFSKLNVFHWHLTDSDSFPIYLPSHPDLQKYGAFSPEQTYNESDVKDIVEYAKVRGIKIIPETDSPSHLTSWSYAPEAQNLINCSVSVWYHGIPFGQINPTLDDTYTLVKDIYTDLQNYFPWEDIHMGCDEVFEYCWNNEDIKKWMADHNVGTWQELFDYYVGQIRKLKDSDRSAVFWGNQDTEFLTFGKDDIIQYWGKNDSLQEYMNHYSESKMVLSNYDSLYFDCGLGNYFGNDAFCNPMHTWREIYFWDPALLVDDNSLSRVLGAEAAQWGELNNDVTTMDRLFPRLTALGERLWSRRDQPYTSLLSIFDRLEAWRNRVNGRGLQVGPLTAGYCENHPSKCFSD